MGAKIKTPKISHAKFPSHKNFQKVLNNITQKKKHNNLFITPSGVRTFSASGGHGNNTQDTQEHILWQQ